MRRKIDRHLLPTLAWVFLLQVLAGTLLDDDPFQRQAVPALTGSQRIVFLIIGSLAQSIWQPVSVVLLVQTPPKILLPALLLGWGVVHTCMAAANTWAGFLIVRFFIGLLQGSTLPLFCLMVGAWYRRAEQPVRIAAWFGMHGLATILKAIMAYSFGKIESPRLEPWQM